MRGYKSTKGVLMEKCPLHENKTTVLTKVLDPDGI